MNPARIYTVPRPAIVYSAISITGLTPPICRLFISLNCTLLFFVCLVVPDSGCQQDHTEPTVLLLFWFFFLLLSPLVLF